MRTPAKMDDEKGEEMMMSRTNWENKMTNDRGLEKKRGVNDHDDDQSSVDSVEKFFSLIGSSQKEK